MIGSILKYSAVAFAGAIGFAVAMHYVDDAAADVIQVTLKDQEALFRQTNPSDDELRVLMAAFIQANRSMWDGTFHLKETATRVQAMYNVWL